MERAETRLQHLKEAITDLYLSVKVRTGEEVSGVSGSHGR